MKCRHYTQEEYEFILRNYPDHNAMWVAEHISIMRGEPVSARSVMAYARRNDIFRITNFHAQKYNQKQLSFIRENYMSMTASEIARRISEMGPAGSSSNICSIARGMRLPLKRPRIWTDNAIKIICDFYPTNTTTRVKAMLEKIGIHATITQITNKANRICVKKKR